MILVICGSAISNYNSISICRSPHICFFTVNFILIKAMRAGRWGFVEKNKQTNKQTNKKKKNPRCLKTMKRHIKHEFVGFEFQGANFREFQGANFRGGWRVQAKRCSNSGRQTSVILDCKRTRMEKTGTKADR